MLLIIKASNFYFGLSVNVVDRIYDVTAISVGDNGAFIEGKEVKIVNAEDVLKVREKTLENKTTAILLSIKNEKPVALLVGSIKGFIDERECNCFLRNELLKNYGFDLVSSFCLCKNELLFVLEEGLLEKRIVEMT